MASAAALALLKADLGMLGTEQPEEIISKLESKLDAAAGELARQRIKIVESDPCDLDLLVCYAGWLYRHSSDGAGKPEMLRSRLNDRKVDNVTEVAL